MQTTIDAAGRVVIPKALRDELGLRPGTALDVSVYGAGLTIVPGGRTARLETDEHGDLVAASSTPIDDEVVFGLIDAGRR